MMKKSELREIIRALIKEQTRSRCKSAITEGKTSWKTLWKTKQTFSLKELDSNKIVKGEIDLEMDSQETYYYKRINLTIWTEPSLVRSDAIELIGNYLYKKLKGKIKIQWDRKNISLYMEIASGKKRDDTYKMKKIADMTEIVNALKTLLKGKLSSIVSNKLKYSEQEQEKQRY